MKTIRIFMLALVCGLFASCMDKDWDSPLSDENAPVGNNSIQETRVVSIKDLKTQYASVINASGCQQIDADIQIKGRVVGNDIESNIYQQLYIDDGTAGMCIAVSTSSINKELGVGQEILVDLKGLYIGAYRQQPQIGGLYKGSIGRMTYNTWKDHFKALGTPDMSQVQPIEVNFNDFMSLDTNVREGETMSDKDKWLADNCGRLVIIRNATIDQSGTKVFAPNDGSVYVTNNCVNRNINKKSTFVLRTSIYSKFKNNPLPEGDVNITGILIRFTNTVQILMRKASDVEEIN